jgi:hypothetical protein
MKISDLRRTIAGVRVSNLFDPGGKPTGWAHHAEREIIRAHLRRRIWKFGLDELRSARLEFRVTAIQQRLHKYDHTFRQLQTLYALQPKNNQPSTDDRFNGDELERLIEHFEGANDPIGQSIATKAKIALDNVRKEGR